MAHSKGKPSTLYMSARTAALSREIERGTGQKTGRLFSQFIEQYCRMARGNEAAARSASIAFALPALASWEVNSPSPLTGIQATPQPRIDIWAEALGDRQPRATRVFLMGLTLEHPITNHEQLWSDFLQTGGFLQVLIQGNLSGRSDAPRIIGAVNPAVNEDRLGAQSRTIEVLKRVARTTESDRIEVRNSGPAQIATNTGLIFREDGTLDIYGEIGFGGRGHFRGVNLVFTGSHTVPGETNELIVRPIEDLWLQSIPEPGFEQSQYAGVEL